jgi:predicted aldo/keto reductase-like oxidoreductase
MMLYRGFGSTELQIPLFSCGGMRHQFKWQDVRPEKIPQDNQENLEAVIRRALEIGITHIETARGYGTSEMHLGKILPQFPREKLIVQTKVSPVAAPQEFRQTFEKSLAYLQLDYVDLFGLYGINNAEIWDL